MKRFLVLMAAVIMAISLTACAGTSGKTAKVKCPACGYEFDAPVTDH